MDTVLSRAVPHGPCGTRAARAVQDVRQAFLEKHRASATFCRSSPAAGRVRPLNDCPEGDQLPTFSKRGINGQQPCWRHLKTSHTWGRNCKNCKKGCRTRAVPASRAVRSDRATAAGVSTRSGRASRPARLYARKWSSATRAITAKWHSRILCLTQSFALNDFRALPSRPLQTHDSRYVFHPQVAALLVGCTASVDASSVRPSAVAGFSRAQAHNLKARPGSARGS
jgi:hypothetical protein